MSFLATSVLVGFLSFSGAFYVHSRRPESDRPSALMMSLSDRADELERKEAQLAKSTNTATALA